MYDIVPQLFVACFVSAYTALLAILLWSGLTARLKPAALKELLAPDWVRIWKTARSCAPHLESPKVARRKASFKPKWRRFLVETSTILRTRPFGCEPFILTSRRRQCAPSVLKLPTAKRLVRHLLVWGSGSIRNRFR